MSSRVVASDLLRDWGFEAEADQLQSSVEFQLYSAIVANLASNYSLLVTDDQQELSRENWNLLCENALWLATRASKYWRESQNTKEAHDTDLSR